VEGPPATPEYVLGRSTSESQRLITQSGFLQPFTERVFRRAGLNAGMRVLDLGCGAGDVSFQAAELVGPTGSVLGIDRDPGVLAVARRRAHEMGLTTISFEEQSIEAFSAPKPFDAVVGRFVLVYQPDPARTLGHVAGLLRPGGILALIEPDMSVGVRSWPRVPLWEQAGSWIGETFRRGGVHHDIGARLYPLIRRAGLPGPTVRQDLLVGGAEALRPAYEHCAAMIRSLLPRMEQFGIATAGTAQVDTLAERLERETAVAESQLAYFPVFGAWTSKVQ
jgi:SAM-dependent methyltransferase